MKIENKIIILGIKERLENFKNKDFNEFLIYWSSFNYLLNEYYNLKDKYDSKKNEFFFNSIKNQDFYKDLLNSNKKFKNKVEELKKICPITNIRSEEDINFNDINSLKEFILCIYTARNNLFHGEKTPIGLRDNEVIIKANNAFNIFLNELLNKLK